MKHTYKKIGLVVMVLLAVFGIQQVVAQTTGVTYAYDATGNRISLRVINMSKSATVTDSAVVENTQKQLKKEKPLEDAIGELKFKIFPNPTAGKIQIECVNLPAETVGRIVIFNMQGKEVFATQNLHANNDVDISSSPVGTYIMRIVAGEKSTAWKIMKR